MQPYDAMASRRGNSANTHEQKMAPPLKRGGCLRGLRVVRLGYRVEITD